MNAIESLKYFLPEMVLLGGAFLALTLDFFTKKKRLVGELCLLMLVVALCLAKVPAKPMPLFSGMFELDTFTHFFRLIALTATGITLLLALGYAPLRSRYEGEFYGIFLFMAFALITVAAAKNLLMIFLAIEFVSLLSYLLVGFLKNDSKSKEAAIKYLLFGSVCSAVMLYGMSLVYGATGSLSLRIIGGALVAAPLKPLAVTAVLFFFVGLGFKISMAPFHMWAPDVYEGAPTPVTAFLTVAPKALGFAVLTRVLDLAFWPIQSAWGPVLVILSMLTMTIGNITAVSQSNIKRFLAYSSIAQAGYILMGFAVFSILGRDAVLIYLAAYLLTNLGAFAIVTYVEKKTGGDSLDAYAGLSQRAPAAAAMLTIFLLSLAGLPPLAGFIAKYYVFAAVIQNKLIALAIVAAVNSVVAAYYYFRIIRLMYLAPATGPVLPAPSKALAITFWILCLGVLTMGLFPDFFITRILG